MDRAFIPPRSSSTSTFNPNLFHTPALESAPNQPPAAFPQQPPRRGNSDSSAVLANRQTLHHAVFGQPSGLVNESWTGFLNSPASDSFPRATSYISRAALDTQRNELIQPPAGRFDPAPSYHAFSNTVAASRKRNASGYDNSTPGEHKRSFPGMRPTSPPTSIGRSGATPANPIDLTTPSPRRRTSLNAPQTNPLPTPRAPSSPSFQLPPWQPDSHVLECPVCKTVFGFWIRKHHCRKCGKVVCDGCSRHRITIPRQYIVQPPPGAANSPFSSTFSALGVSPPGRYLEIPSGVSRGPWIGDFSDAALTGSSTSRGAEVVRVCNPCVPDPNLSPPPQTPVFGLPGVPPLHSSFALPSRDPAHQSDLFGARPPPIPERRGSGLQGFGDSFITTPSQGSNREQFLGNAPPPPISSNLRPGHGFNPAYPPQFVSGRRATLASSSTRSPGTQHPNHPYRSIGPSQAPSSLSHRPAHSISSLPSHTVPPNYPSSHPVRFATPRPPRREIPEEDECPVCGRELPPKGANGDTKAREKHVENCIALHSFSLSTPPAPASAVISPTSQPSSSRVGTTPSNRVPTASSGSGFASNALNVRSGAPEPPQPSLGASSSSAPSPSSASTAQQNLAQRTNRMITYRASEKDCLGEDGEAQECVICFEEFEPGDDMGRLECWCKFHRHCIRRWWETKGSGSCPTHQLHG